MTKFMFVLQNHGCDYSINKNFLFCVLKVVKEMLTKWGYSYCLWKNLFYFIVYWSNFGENVL